MGRTAHQCCGRGSDTGRRPQGPQERPGPPAESVRREDGEEEEEQLPYFKYISTATNIIINEPAGKECVAKSANYYKNCTRKEHTQKSKVGARQKTGCVHPLFFAIVVACDPDWNVATTTT